MVHNGILIETIGISVMVSIGLLLFFLAGADAVTEPQDAVIIQIKHPDGNERRRKLLIAQRLHSGMFFTVCVHVLHMVPVFARLFKKVRFGIIKMLFHLKGPGCICWVLLSCFHCSQQYRVNSFRVEVFTEDPRPEDPGPDPGPNLLLRVPGRFNIVCNIRVDRRTPHPP